MFHISNFFTTQRGKSETHFPASNTYKQNCFNSTLLTSMFGKELKHATETF
jgi:hypothetical protein